MKDIVAGLWEQNMSYFCGKGLKFDNRASFFQCVIDPVRPNSYIAAQHRNSSEVNKKTEYEWNYQVVHLENDDEIFDSPSTFQPELLSIGATSECDSDDGFMYNDSRTLISFWRLNAQIADGQYECYEIVSVRNVLEKEIKSNEQATKKCLFTGLNNKVFFFSMATFNEGADSSDTDDGFNDSDTMHLCVQGCEGLKTQKFQILRQGKVEEKLKEQLGLTFSRT